MVQSLNPDGVTFANWSRIGGSSNLDAINDYDSPNDSQYFFTSSDANFIVVTFPAGDDPFLQTGHKILVRGRRTAALSGFKVELWDGTSSKLWEKTQNFSSTAFANYTITVPDAETDDINYDDIQLRFYGSGTGGSNISIISEVQVELPDPIQAQVTRIVAKGSTAPPPRVETTRLVAKASSMAPEKVQVSRVVAKASAGVIPWAIVTRMVAKVSTPPPPSVEVSRLIAKVSYENDPSVVQVSRVVAKASYENVIPANIEVSRIVAKVSRNNVAPVGTVEARVSRFIGEAIIQDVALSPQSPLRVSTVDFEIYYKKSDEVRVTRVIGEVLGEFEDASLDDIRITRVIGEILGDLGETPPDPDDDPEIPAILSEPMLAHRGDQDIVLESIYRTDISASRETQAEDRLRLLARPERVQTLTLRGLGKSAANRLWTNIVVHSNEKQLVPLSADPSVITADSSGTTINCETRWRRFTVGGYAILYKWGDGDPGFPSVVHTSKIQSFAGSQLILETALPETFPAGSRCYPGMFVEVATRGQSTLFNPVTNEVRLTLREQIGPTALRSAAGDVSFPTFEGKPILNVQPEWSRTMRPLVLRTGKRYPGGRKPIFEPTGDRPKIGFDINYKFIDRESAWGLISFMDLVKGRGRSFYIVSPQCLWDPVAVGPSFVTIKRFGIKERVEEFMPFVGIESKSGVIYIGEVDSIDDTTTNGEPTWTVNFKNTIDGVPGVPSLKKVTSAHLMKRDTDAFVENWLDGESMEGTMRVLEALDERTVNYGGTPGEDQADFTSPDDIDALHFWCDASVNAYTGGTVGDRDGGIGEIDRWVSVWDKTRQTPSIENLIPRASSAFNYSVWDFGGDPGQNNGRLTLKSNSGSGPTTRASFQLQNENAFFADNDDGLTIFIHYQAPLGQEMDTMFEQSGILEWGPTQAQIYETDGVSDSDYIASYTNLNDGIQFKAICLNWKPSIFFRVYKHGSLAGESAASPPSIPIVTRERILARAEALATGINVNSIMIFRKSLSTEEMNFVGNYLHGIYGGKTWDDI